MKTSTLLRGALMLSALFYLSAASMAQVFTVGNGNNTTTSTLDSPYGTFYMDDRTQILYLASEITAAGGYAGSISAFGLNCSSNASMAMGSFTISIGTTTATSIAGAYSTATLTQVYQVGSFTTSVGWQTFEFSTPFNWNGTDNIVIDVCFDNSAWSSPSGGVRADYYYGRVYSRYQDNSSGSICGTNNGWGGTGGYRAQGQFTILPPYPNDAGIGSILSPVLPTCDLDSLDIDVTINNLGSDTLHNCSIKYQINTGAVQSMYYTGTVLPQGGSLDTVNLGNESFSNGDQLVVWTEMPNGVPDSLNFNDNDTIVVATGLSGNYGIPADFATIDEATTALNTFGVCDHVVINLASGTYTEQLTLGEVLGTSEDATITFQSATGNQSDVTIQYAANSQANNWVVNLDGADWIRVRDMRLRATGTSIYANVVDIQNGADNNIIDNCWLKSNSIGSTSVGNYRSVIYWSGANHGNTITNNRVEAGNTSFYSTGGSAATPSEDIRMDSNIFEDHYYYGVYCDYFDGFEFNNNTVTNDSASYFFYMFYGLRMRDVSNFNVTGNYVGSDINNAYYYTFYMYNCVGSNNPRSQVANNCVFGGADGSTSYGYYTMYSYNSGLFDFHHNSVTRQGGAGGNWYAMYITNGGLISLKNNSIANLAGGYAFYSPGGFTITESDYNNLYTESGSLVYWGASAYSSIEAYQEASGYDMNSVQTDPNYINALECITCNDTLSDNGTPVATAMDIDGNVRSVQNPDIGAMEFVNANSFSLGADDTLCGNEIILEAGPAQSVAWGVSENGGATQTYTTSAITLMTSGGAPSEFEVDVVISTEYCGNATDDVVVRLIPDATLDSSAHICADATETLSPGGGTTAAYAWSTGETTATIDVAEPGTYNVIKMEDGCESEATIMVTQSVAVSIADIEGCEDDAPLTVDATIPDGSSYAWTGGSSQTTASNDFTESGSYSVTATDIHGCVSSSDFELLVLGEPDADIDYVGTGGTAFLFSSAGTSNTSPNTTYSWTFNSIDTSTAANPTYVFPWNGAPTTYPVTLVVDNGCGESLKNIEITVDPIGINEVAEKKFEIYPNPASNNVFVSAGSDWKSLDVTIYDNAGRAVQSESFNGAQQVEINTSELASGTYMIKLVSETSNEVHTLIIQ